MERSSLGDRMKRLEAFETERAFLPGLPILARLDGRAFHMVTHTLDGPYDARFQKLMDATTHHLVEESNALIGYTQSDEIQLLFHTDNEKSQLFFDGSPFKMTSILAATASVFFNEGLNMHALGSLNHYRPVFDCRVWAVPSKVEAVNAFIWRELDATRNSVSMAARAHYSHHALDKKNNKEMQIMLWQKGVNWDQYPSRFKRGVYFQRQRVMKKFTTEEMDALPLKHDARKNPDLEFERSEIRKLELPPLLRIRNKEGVLFNGEDFVVYAEEEGCTTIVG